MDYFEGDFDLMELEEADVRIMDEIQRMAEDGLWSTSEDHSLVWHLQKTAKAYPKEALRFLKSLRETRQKDLEEAQKKKKAHTAEAARLRRKAKKLGIKEWRALYCKSLSEADILRMETVLAQEGWSIAPAYEKEAPLMELGSPWVFVRNPSAENELSWTITTSTKPRHSRTYEISTEELVKALAESKTDDMLVPLLTLYNRFGSNATKEPYVLRSKTHIERCLAGKDWAENGALREACRDSSAKPYRIAASFTPRLARTLLRLPEEFRYAALLPLGTNSEKHVLNWDAVRKAKKDPAFRFESLPYDTQWLRLFGFSRGAAADFRNSREQFMGRASQGARPSLVGLKLSVVRKLCQEVGLPLEKKTFEKKAVELENLNAIIRLTRMFADTEAIRRVVKNLGHPWTKKGLHDAGQFTCNATSSHWSGLCQRHPEALSLAGNFATLEARKLFPSSLSELRREVKKLGYPVVDPEWEALRDACINAGLPGSAYADYEKFWKRKPEKQAEFLPEAKVLGTELGLENGWVFKKLAHNDYLGPLLGLVSGCCQHLLGPGSASAIAGVKSPYSGFYVVTHNKKVILQSWAWRTKEGDLVMDSVESMFRQPEELKVAFELFAKGLQRIAESPLGIARVFVGATTSGVTDSFMKSLAPETALCEYPVYREKPQENSGYFDGSAQYLVVGVGAAKRIAPKKRATKKKGLPAVEGYTLPAPEGEERLYRTREELIELILEQRRQGIFGYAGEMFEHQERAQAQEIIRMELLHELEEQRLGVA